MICLYSLERDDERKTGSQPRLRGAMLFLIPLWSGIALGANNASGARSRFFSWSRDRTENRIPLFLITLYFASHALKRVVSASILSIQKAVSRAISWDRFSGAVGRSLPKSAGTLLAASLLGSP